jgi:hypothetical protein
MIGLDQTMGSPIRQEENHWNGNNRQGEYDGSIEGIKASHQTQALLGNKAARKPLHAS